MPVYGVRHTSSEYINSDSAVSQLKTNKIYKFPRFLWYLGFFFKFYLIKLLQLWYGAVTIHSLHTCAICILYFRDTGTEESVLSSNLLGHLVISPENNKVYVFLNKNMFELQASRQSNLIEIRATKLRLTLVCYLTYIVQCVNC